LRSKPVELIFIHEDPPPSQGSRLPLNSDKYIFSRTITSQHLSDIPWVWCRSGCACHAPHTALPQKGVDHHITYRPRIREEKLLSDKALLLTPVTAHKPLSPQCIHVRNGCHHPHEHIQSNLDHQQPSNTSILFHGLRYIRADKIQTNLFVVSIPASESAGVIPSRGLLLTTYQLWMPCRFYLVPQP
jgi:hypothetical protein